MSRPAGASASVTGHYAGPVTRLVAFSLDVFAMVTLFGLLTGLVVFLLGLFTGETVTLSDGHDLLRLAGLVSWSILYFWVPLALVGKTPAKALVGLRVVAADGNPLRGRRALVRVLAIPFSFALLGLGLIGVVVGSRRRALHDVVAGSVVVYDWGDRAARLPAPLTQWLERHQAAPAGETGP